MTPTSPSDAAEAAADEAPTSSPPCLPVAVDRPVQTVGRRKEAVVRVRLVPGTGNVHAQRPHHGRVLPEQGAPAAHQGAVGLLEKDDIYDVYATLHGGGVTGQAGALRLGIARALIELDETDRPPLKKAGFLTRDARAKERKKYGLKKARKAPQYSKR